MYRRPVLYLDLDDTLIAWQDGQPRAADGAHEFLSWALATFEVRWLTTWCPSGEMEPSLLADLARMVRMPTEVLERVRGVEWSEEGSKLDGVAWLEHLVGGRPFVWLEDDYGVGEAHREFLREHGFIDSYFHVNVSEEPASLRRVFRSLKRRFGPSESRS